MSQEVEIIEGARGRSFSRVNRIKTDKQDGGACFWVPENERRLTSLPAFQNGEYEPGKGYYAFDSVDASVMHFDDFDINIDDYDLPHIDLDGIDITIDETGIPHINFDYEIVTVDDETIKVIYPGGKEVIIHGPDLDGPVNIDDVFTIDYDKETGAWTITAITDVTSGDNEYGPGDIVAQWPGTEHVDIHIGQSISIPDLGDIDLDFDADIDVSVDLDDMDVDISGIDMDGLDVDVNIDLDTLNADTFDLPDEIRIMHVPNKTSYKDGEEIDLDGLVVQAYRNGEVWEDKEGKYYNGYVPAHELNFDPKYAIVDHDKSVFRLDDFSIELTKNLVIDARPRWIQSDRGYTVLHLEYRAKSDDVFFAIYKMTSPYDSITDLSERHRTEYHVLLVSEESGQYERYSKCSLPDGVQPSGDNPSYYERTDTYSYTSAFFRELYSWNLVPRDSFPFGQDAELIFWPLQFEPDWDYLNTRWRWPYAYPDATEYMSSTLDAGNEHPWGWTIASEFTKRGIPSSDIEEYFYKNYTGKEHPNSIKISWQRPHDEKILTASFEISVEEGATQTGGTTSSGDHGGSHHSGQFGYDDESENGHWGGTTVSGDHGGSHSSGKF